MIAFLTSHIGGTRRTPGGYVPDRLMTANGLTEALAACWPASPARVLIIAADPANREKNDRLQCCWQSAFPMSGLPVAEMEVCDGRAPEKIRSLDGYDALILAGGHVPTQNAFFCTLHLRERLQGYAGIVIGVSAGSMNSAEEVYAHPELPGEAADPAFRRFLPGLGLTRQMILPHYQLIREDVLDGLRVFEDVAYPDSMGRTFLALNDGSYLLIREGRETLHGEAREIRDGACRVICRDGETLELTDDM